MMPQYRDCSSIKKLPIQVLLVLALLLFQPCLAGSASPQVKVTDTTYPLVWDKSQRRAAGYKAPVELPDGSLLAASTTYTLSGTLLRCLQSKDTGATWSLRGVIATDPERYTDLGDCTLLRLRSGEILCSYRHNSHSGRASEDRHYSIAIAMSHDGGVTWQPHSVVAEASGNHGGLWSSFVLEKQDGTLLCFYDDEVTPWQQGFRRHQWLTSRRWDRATHNWVDPVTVSRAESPKHLSRDGMCSVVEVTHDHLLCLFESVRVEPPHRSVIRSVTSEDGGRTWSWSRPEGRSLVYGTADPLHNSLAPWAARLRSGSLMCVFSTDEDRDIPDVPSTGHLDENIKAVYSSDDGNHWSRAPQTVVPEHPCYMAGFVELTTGTAAGNVFLHYKERRGFFSRLGRPSP